jgi:hypothetical protein
VQAHHARLPTRTARQIGAAGAGLIGSAIFPTDPVSGYRQEHPACRTHPPMGSITDD